MAFARPTFSVAGFVAAEVIFSVILIVAVFDLQEAQTLALPPLSLLPSPPPPAPSPSSDPPRLSLQLLLRSTAPLYPTPPPPVRLCLRGARCRLVPSPRRPRRARPLLPTPVPPGLALIPAPPRCPPPRAHRRHQAAVPEPPPRPRRRQRRPRRQGCRRDGGAVPERVRVGAAAAGFGLVPVQEPDLLFPEPDYLRGGGGGGGAHPNLRSKHHTGGPRLLRINRPPPRAPPAAGRGRHPVAGEAAIVIPWPCFPHVDYATARAASAAGAIMESDHKRIRNQEQMK